MKRLFSLLALASFLLVGCNTNSIKRVDMDSVPLVKGSFQIHEIDSIKTLNPKNLFCFGNHVILIEYKNAPFLSFWSPDSLTYEFSAGDKGGGPNELIDPYSDYFAKSDSSFFLLDSQVEREIQVTGNDIQIINNKPLIFSDAINQLVRVEEDAYIMLGRTDGSDNAEHIKITPDGNKPFGQYPANSTDKTSIQFFEYYKLTAGLMGEKTIWDFYESHNLIRQYSIDGELLQEVSLDFDERQESTASTSDGGKGIYYWIRVIASNHHIYALFKYDTWKSTKVPELQVWDWDGNLTARYQFDKYYNAIAVSDNGVLYAMDTMNHPYEVYTYDLNK